MSMRFDIQIEKHGEVARMSKLVEAYLELTRSLGTILTNQTLTYQQEY